MTWYATQSSPKNLTQNPGRLNMGEAFAAQTYVPMSGQQKSIAGYQAGRLSSQMWNTDAAKTMYEYLPPEMKQIVFDYTTSQLGHAKHNTATQMSYYEKAVDAVARENMILGGDPRDLFGWMSDRVSNYINSGGSLGGSSGGGGGGGGGAGGGPTSQTTVQLTNQSDAEVLVDQALNQYLGRQATDGERDQFWKMLNRQQMKSPTVTTNSGGTNNTSMTAGGVNTQEAAKEFALSRDDAAEYMANTQYTDWLMEKIAADPTEGIASGL